MTQSFGAGGVNKNYIPLKTDTDILDIKKIYNILIQWLSGLTVSPKSTLHCVESFSK